MRPKRSTLGLHLLFASSLLLPAATKADSLVSVTMNPTNIVSGSPLEETVTLDGPATSDLFVTISSDHPDLVGVYSLVVPAGEVSQSWVIPTTGYLAPGQSPIVVTVSATTDGDNFKTATVRVMPRDPVRGVAGDLWADVILGKPGFGEVVPNEVKGGALFLPAGTIVDRSSTPNRVYVYDGGNSRVLGFDHLGTCVGGGNAGRNCTTNSDCPGSTCAVVEGRGADLVLGQPTFNSSACNGDGAFQRYPMRAPASASTLCTMQEDQISVAEWIPIGNMFVDGGGNLYVPDSANNRVLRYNSPFTSDRIADDVWGQADFTGNECNRGAASPNDQSTCFPTGVALDAGGNLWVADFYNNRVLRFPHDPDTGSPGYTADVVLGQPDFVSSGVSGHGLNQMGYPNAVRIDGAGFVYVTDSHYDADDPGRVLIFAPNPSSGDAAIGTLPYPFNVPTGLEVDPAGGIWVNDTNNNQLLLFKDGVLQKVLFTDEADSTGQRHEGCVGDRDPFAFPDGVEWVASWDMLLSRGSIGIDGGGSLFASGFQDEVWRFPGPIPTPTPLLAHSADARLFNPYQEWIANEVGLAGLSSPSGIVVAADQLIVADGGRLLFWNHPPNFTNGQKADGYVGVTDPRLQPPWLKFGRIREDGNSHLWAIWTDQIRVYDLPLTGNDTPIWSFGPTLPVLGGGSLTWDAVSLDIGGIAPVGAGDKVWIADPDNNRVFRIRDALTSPIVDIVLGQSSVSGTQCNQGRGENDYAPSADSLCQPGAVRLDPQGNLYVADDSAEVTGNYRLLEFDASHFTDSPTSALFAIPADRVFGTGGSFTIRGCRWLEICTTIFEPAFTSDGQMVVGGNAYQSPRFPLVYGNPLVDQHVTTFLNDFYSWPQAATFDSSDNLYFVDGDRFRVLIYLNPLASRPASPTITGITPDTGSTAGGTPVTITGTGFESGASVSLGGIAVTGVVVTPPDTITTTTAAHAAGSVDVVVTNPDSQSATLTGGFTYVTPPPTPTIRSFTPTSGIAGSSVTITGTNFTWVVSVSFNGVPASFSVTSTTSITATVPAGATTGKITVTTMGGTATSTASFTVRPSIAGFTPESGAPGVSVSIMGSGFNGATAVRFNGATAAFTVDSSIQITATVPATATTGKITVVTPVGSATSSTDFVVAPRITSFSPTSGLIGASVAINGANFTGATAVTFNGTPATYTVNSATRITATVPSGATTGPIAVSTPAGTATSTGVFSIKPSITSFTPGSGDVGVSVTITGIAFTGATAVKFHGTTAVFTVDSWTQITATVPAGATTGTITVTTPVGTATSLTNFVVAPRITSFSPTSGLIGASVAINGANFTGASAVTFNGTPATYTVNSATRITATVPSGATTGPIGVATSAGTATSTGIFSIRPSISGFTPGSGAPGISVTITGIAFTGATAVKFHGTTAAYSVDSWTQITATVPAGATTGTITVSTPVGTATSLTDFVVAPRITSFSPTSGLIGASVAINGANFTGASAVTFSGTPATYTVNSAIRITATVPSGATTGPIAVSTPAGTATSTGNFSIRPSISGFTPGSGAVGVSVTITGIAFTGATAVKFNGTTAVFTVDSWTQITATVPSGATTGKITVTTPVGSATSATDFVVAPRITSFSPTSGLIGASVAINGANFTGASAVTFNGTPATYTVNSATRITATVPSGATTGPIGVATSAGTATSTSSFTVR